MPWEPAEKKDDDGDGRSEEEAASLTFICRLSSRILTDTSAT